MLGTRVSTRNYRGAFFRIGGNVLLVLQEQLQVDLKHSLEQTHVCALVQTDLVLPDVDNQDFTGRQRKESGLALKVLVFTSLATICTLDVHHQDIICHRRFLILVLGHPDTLGGLSSLQLGHDREMGSEEMVE